MELESMDWSLILNVISVPAAIFFGWKSYTNGQQMRNEKKTEELAVIGTKLNRITRIESSSKPLNATFCFSSLINDGVLTHEVINDIVAKCKKYNLGGKELDGFEEISNCALANKHFGTLPAQNLVSSAHELEAIVKNCT